MGMELYLVAFQFGVKSGATDAKLFGHHRKVAIAISKRLADGLLFRSLQFA